MTTDVLLVLDCDVPNQFNYIFVGMVRVPNNLVLKYEVGNLDTR